MAEVSDEEQAIMMLKLSNSVREIVRKELQGILQSEFERLAWDNSFFREDLAEQICQTTRMRDKIEQLVKMENLRTKGTQN